MNSIEYSQPAVEMLHYCIFGIWAICYKRRSNIELSKQILIIWVNFCFVQASLNVRLCKSQWMLQSLESYILTLSFLGGFASIHHRSNLQLSSKDHIQIDQADEACESSEEEETVR